MQELGFKGERGYSAYEVAVKNGFKGTEETWLAQLGTSSGAKQETITYVTKGEGETEFTLPESYTSNSIVEVYVDGVKLSPKDYTIEGLKLTLTTPIQKTGAVVDISVITMTITNLPLVKEINESSDDTTAPSAKLLYDTKIELERLIKEAHDLIEKVKVPEGGKEGQVLIKNSETDNDTKWTELDWLNKTRPIGSFYISENSTEPSELFGGEWERVQDVFLLAAGAKHVAGSTGGSEKNTHTHFQTTSFDGNSIYHTSSPTKSRTKTAWVAVIKPDSYNKQTGLLREDSTYEETIDIMPPHLTVYIWKRIA